jgi:hypothetical protein
MQIGAIAVERRGSSLHYAAMVGGRELFFQLDDPAVTPTGNPADAFLLMALGPAMFAGTPIVVERDPVSPVLIENLERAQDVYHAWDRRFRKVPIRALTARASDTAAADVMATYSGGADSLYSLLQHEGTVTSALMIGGFDMEPTGDQLREARARNQGLLACRGITPRFVATNQRAWGKHFGVNRPLLYSAYLAAAGLLFGPSRLLIASGYPYGRSPTDGSEPYLDLFWSNGRTRVEQTGSDAWRSQKIKAIAEHPDLLAALRVCLHNQNHNCARCFKCIRTMVTLRILGVQGPFPRVMEIAEIRRLALTEHELHFAIDNALIASELGAADELRALQTAIARFDRSQVLVQLDRWLFRGWLRKQRRRRRDYDEGLVGFEPRPDLEL